MKHQHVLSKVTKESSFAKKQPILISISSGKGGVGKSLSVAQLSLVYARQGLSVLIIDGDLGLSNIEVLFNLKPKSHLQDVMRGRVHLRDTITVGPFGINIISSGSGITELQTLSLFHKQLFMTQIMELPFSYDCIMIDTPAGIGDHVMHFNQIATHNIVVTTPDPHAITDAYALMKVLCEHSNIKSFKLIVNMTRHNEEGELVARRLQNVAKQFLHHVNIEFIGSVPFDHDMSSRLIRRQLDETSQTVSGQAWAKIAGDIAKTKIAHIAHLTLYEMMFPQV